MFDFKVAEMQVDYVDHLGGDINVVNAAKDECLYRFNKVKVISVTQPVGVL